MNTPNVCNNAEGNCVGDYSTANLNNYIMSNNGGVGPSYTNMCVKVRLLCQYLETVHAV